MSQQVGAAVIRSDQTTPVVFKAQAPAGKAEETESSPARLKNSDSSKIFLYQIAACYNRTVSVEELNSWLNSCCVRFG